jgi:hypothetical protein
VGKCGVSSLDHSGECPWYLGRKKISLKGARIGSVRTFIYEYMAGKNNSKQYVFSAKMTAYNADKHSMTFRVRRLDYPNMVMFGTIALDSLGPQKDSLPLGV